MRLLIQLSNPHGEEKKQNNRYPYSYPRKEKATDIQFFDTVKLNLFQSHPTSAYINNDNHVALSIDLKVNQKNSKPIKGLYIY